MRLRATIALVLAGLGFAFLGPVSAADAYPVVTCSTLAVSTTSPAAGESITVTGTHFKARATVRIELHTRTYLLKTLTTRADGTFSAEVTLPTGVSGSHLIVAVGGTVSASGCPADASVGITVQGSGVAGVAASAPAGGAAAGQSTGATAFTGVNVLLMLIVAAILIVVGVMLNRRNAAKHAMPRNDY